MESYTVVLDVLHDPECFSYFKLEYCVTSESDASCLSIANVGF